MHRCIRQGFLTPAYKSLRTSQEIYIEYFPGRVNGCVDRTCTTRQYANKVERDLRELKRRRRELIEKGRSKESVKQVETRINELMLQFNERVGALQK